MSDFPGANCMVAMKDVSYSIKGRPVLEDINLCLEEGEFLGVIGPNGAGKTTLLRLILGLIKPSTGIVRLLGSNPAGINNARRFVGYLPQIHRFEARFPVSVFDVVMMGRFSKVGMFKFPGKEDRKVALKALELVGLPKSIAKRYFAGLSGGQQQLVLLARALCSKPLLLILDEPTNGLDGPAQKGLFQTLLRLREELNLTIIIISHNVIFIAGYARELMCINRRIVVRGAPREVMSNPLTSLAYGYGETDGLAFFTEAGGKALHVGNA